MIKRLKHGPQRTEKIFGIIIFGERWNVLRSIASDPPIP
jgi:hypothetical protein